jgi:hypothetical protein
MLVARSWLCERYPPLLLDLTKQRDRRTMNVNTQVRVCKLVLNADEDLQETFWGNRRSGAERIDFGHINDVGWRATIAKPELERAVVIDVTPFLSTRIGITDRVRLAAKHRP